MPPRVPRAGHLGSLHFASSEHAQIGQTTTLYFSSFMMPKMTHYVDGSFTD